MRKYKGKNRWGISRTSNESLRGPYDSSRKNQKSLRWMTLYKRYQTIETIDKSRIQKIWNQESGIWRIPDKTLNEP